MKISITTPSFNSEKHIEETIKSIVEQDYPNLEYIIVDGASTDNTLKIIDKYKQKVTKLISEKDSGISDAFNKAVGLTSGELIGNINSDDYLLPGALKYIAEHINDDTDVIYGKGYRLFNNGKLVEYNPKPLKDLYNCMALLHPAVFVRKRAYEKFGVFDLNYKACMDRDLMLRMYHGGAKFQYVDKALVVYRMGGVSEKAYFTHTLPEREDISIKYGMPVWKAKWQTFYSYFKMKLVFFRDRRSF